MPLQPRSKCNLFYGREACNVTLPNSDVAILLGTRVLVEFTATGDINGVTAAKRSCSFVRQPAGRPLQLPHRAWRGTSSRGGVVLVSVVLAATPCCGVPTCNQSLSTATRCGPHRWGQEKPQCLLLSSGILLDVLMRRSTHRLLQMKPHTCDTSCAVRGTTLTTTGAAHAPSVRTTSKRKKHGCVRVTAKHPLAITSHASPQAAPAALQATG
ncbi:hypothetical protein TcCL_ESM10506 [Trypanosoma cruzi]|nr:hypothetical protein TcCL_ESM10506 [Trypanosoma cruzi]